MPIRVAINGFGRIGRAAFRVIFGKSRLKVVAINDVTDAGVLAHLLKYDTVYRTHAGVVEAEGDAIVVDGERYPVSAIQEPAKLPWRQLKVDVVLECTGRFTNRGAAAAHLAAGARQVVISAPGKDEQTPTVVLGTAMTTQQIRRRQLPTIVSNASCTTNCIAPVVQVLASSFGVRQALMTTVHSYTADQVLVDGPHRLLRRARAAAQNMVTTSTGAAITTAAVVERGRSGGITLLGTVSGVAGALFVAILGRVFLDPLVAPGILVGMIAGISGLFADSLLGATLEARWMTNDTVNLLATLVGAVVAALF